ILLKPSSGGLARSFVRHYPKHIALFLGEKSIAETMKIFPAGDTCQLAAAEEAPQQNHRTTVRNGHIGVYHRLSIGVVPAKSCEACPRWRHQKTASFRHRATARPTSPLKNLIPSICSVGVIDRRQLIAVARHQ